MPLGINRLVGLEGGMINNQPFIVVSPTPSMTQTPVFPSMVPV